MAQITQVTLVDDLDGGEAVESVAFSLDGKFYEIDLSEKHAAALRDVFATFVGSARRTGAGAKAASGQRMAMRSAGRSRADSAAIREWATAQGLDVSARGRISSTVLEAYQNGSNTLATPAGADAAATETAAEPVVETEAKPKRSSRRKATSQG